MEIIQWNVFCWNVKFFINGTFVVLYSGLPYIRANTVPLLASYSTFTSIWLVAGPKFNSSSMWQYDWVQCSPWRRWPWRGPGAWGAAPPSLWSEPAACGLLQCHRSPPRSETPPHPTDRQASKQASKRMKNGKQQLSIFRRSVLPSSTQDHILLMKLKLPPCMPRRYQSQATFIDLTSRPWGQTKVLHPGTRISVFFPHVQYPSEISLPLCKSLSVAHFGHLFILHYFHHYLNHLSPAPLVTDTRHIWYTSV